MTAIDWKAAYAGLCSKSGTTRQELRFPDDSALDYEFLTVELMGRLYREAEVGLRELAEWAGISHWTVRAKLKAAGVEMKTRGSGMQRKSTTARLV